MSNDSILGSSQQYAVDIGCVNERLLRQLARRRMLKLRYATESQPTPRVPIWHEFQYPDQPRSVLTITRLDGSEVLTIHRK